MSDLPESLQRWRAQANAGADTRSQAMQAALPRTLPNGPGGRAPYRQPARRVPNMPRQMQPNSNRNELPSPYGGTRTGSTAGYGSIEQQTQERAEGAAPLQFAAEATTMPGWYRTGQALGEERYGDAALEGGLSALGLATMGVGPEIAGARGLFGAGRARAPRVPIPEAPAPMTLEQRFGPSIQRPHAGPFDWSRVGRENTVGGFAENMELGDIAPGAGWDGVPDIPAKPMGWADGMLDRVRQERLAREALNPQTEPPPAPIRPPPRQIGANGLPVRPPEPFRNSMRGGSEDLREAARPRTQQPRPDGGAAPSVRVPRRTYDVPHAPGYGTGTFEVLQNPSRTQIESFVARELRESPSAKQWARQAGNDDPLQYYPLRYMRDADGNVYVASGLDVEHSHMARGLRAQGVNLGEDSTRSSYGAGQMTRRDGQWSYNDKDGGPGPAVDYNYGRTSQQPAVGSAQQLPDWIVRNPTDQQLAQMQGDELKYVMDTDGNTYAFSAADGHHNQAMRALRDSGVQVRSLGEGAEITDPDAAGFIWRNKDGSFAHENANMVETGPFSAFQQRVAPARSSAAPGRSSTPFYDAFNNRTNMSIGLPPAPRRAPQGPVAVIRAGGRTYRGADHIEALDRVPPRYRAQAEADYAADARGGNSNVGFEIDGKFYPRAEAMTEFGRRARSGQGLRPSEINAGRSTPLNVLPNVRTVPELRSDPFHDPRLTAQQNKAVEMLNNGYQRSAIADELDITPEHLSQVFRQARIRGVDVPVVTGKRESTVQAEVARLSRITDQQGNKLSAAQIAERLRSMGYDRVTTNSVHVIRSNLRKGGDTLAGSAGFVPVPQVVQRDLRRVGEMATKGSGAAPRALPRQYGGFGGRAVAMGDFGKLPFDQGPRFVGQLPRRANNAPVDPKAVWAGAGLLSIPTGAATAGLVTQNAEELKATERMQALNAQNRVALNSYQRGPPQGYQNPGRPQQKHISLDAGWEEFPNEGYAINPATGRPLPAPKQQRMTGKPTTGLLDAGNIDLNNRPRVQNSDGSISTVRSMSFQDDRGREVLVPTVSDDGRIMTDAEAVAAYRNSGRQLGVFRTPEAANSYAEQLHQQQARRYAKRNAPAFRGPGR